MLARLTVLLPFLALLVKAVTVTSPTEGQNWGTTGAQTVSWSSVESDPSSFTVLLVNDRDQSFQDVTLVANQSTSAGSISVSPPSGSWTTGQAYRINLVRSGAILAQSPQFNVTSSGSAGSSASSSTNSISIASSSSVSIPSAMTSAGASVTANTMMTTAPYSGNAQPTASGVPAAAPTNGATSSSSVNKVVLAGLGMISVGYLVGA